tara:strand:+ start:325 stop:2205 length:1881 start_codon:yes stop_codon:yes gene_type:complete
MCGIAVCYSKKFNSQETVKNIINKIKHRGPDNESFLNLKNISLGSCRLSIFDLSSKGNMPMTDSTGRYTIVYNGEIYNFKNLKTEFNLDTRTNTDTEILLEMYVKKKEKCLDYFNGIFAFVIYDKQENSFFCARDHLGVKPLYYFYDGENFVVSSEINGLSKFHNNKLNLNKLKSYLTTSFYDYGVDTFYENIKQLRPGCYIKYSLNNNIFKSEKYWDLQNTKNKISNQLSKNITEQDLVTQANTLIGNSFKLQTKADVKIGLNVSSGIDSQLMLHFVNEINQGQKDVAANSFYFDDQNYNEMPDLQKTSNELNWNINYYKITSEDIIKNFDEILKIQEGPFPGVPTIAKSLLIKRAYDQNCKVILEAQGGDDVAGGYKYIFGPYILDLLKTTKFKKILSESLEFKKIEGKSWAKLINFIYKSISTINSGGLSADGTNNINLDILDKNFLKDNISDKSEIINDISMINGNLNKIIYRDIFFTKLQRILKSCDRSSMAYGKELRVPLLDRNIAEFFYNLNSDFKIKNGNLRYLYRKVCESKLKKNAFVKKKYVSDPQIKWLKKDLFDWAYSILSDEKTFYDGIYNSRKLLNLFDNFRKNEKEQNSNLFWQAICMKKMIKNFTVDKYS